MGNLKIIPFSSPLSALVLASDSAAHPAASPGPPCVLQTRFIQEARMFKPTSPLLPPSQGNGHPGLQNEAEAQRRATWEVAKEGAPDTHFCWSFIVSMMLLSSRTCVLSSSTAAWLLAAGSIFGFPSEPNRDGELALCPAVPKEDDRGEGVAEDRGAGPPLPPAAMVPGLGGRDALLSDTCVKGRRRGFRRRIRV